MTTVIYRSRSDDDAVSTFLNILVQCNVDVVFSQKTIHSMLQEIFMKHNIILLNDYLFDTLKL